MYTTRRLSQYKNSPEAISLAPEGPNSSYLVIQDEESTGTRLFGLLDDPSINSLPFPQNKRISVAHTTHSGAGEHRHSRTSYDKVYLIPVINTPLSANRYYAIKADGYHKGESYASSKDEDMGICFFCIPSLIDVKPRPFDPEDIYQQFEFSVKETWLSYKFEAKSVAPNGIPPRFLSRRGWRMSGKTLKYPILGDAPGVDTALRAHLPELNFSVIEERSKSVTLGKWYCPFIFIKDGTSKGQIKHSVFYEMTLEQRWERVFTADNTYGQEKTVSVDVLVPTEVVRIGGEEAVQVEANYDKGVVWFRPIDNALGSGEPVGLSKLIMERMVWEQERVGWIKGKGKRFQVVKDENYEGAAGWKSFGLYMLVESFALKRGDGRTVLTYEFNHTHQLRSKWEGY